RRKWTVNEIGIFYHFFKGEVREPLSLSTTKSLSIKKDYFAFLFYDETVRMIHIFSGWSCDLVDEEKMVSSTRLFYFSLSAYLSYREDELHFCSIVHIFEGRLYTRHLRSSFILCNQTLNGLF